MLLKNSVDAMPLTRPIILLDPDASAHERAQIFAALGRMPEIPKRADVLGVYSEAHDEDDINDLLSIDHPRLTEVCVHAATDELNDALYALICETESSLIVAGMHPRTGLQTLRRSNSKSVLNKQANVDFLLVNMAHKKSLSDGYDNVLIAVDSTSAARRVIERTCQYGLNQSAKCVLTILPTAAAIEGVTPYRVFSKSPKLEMQREVDATCRENLSRILRGGFEHVDITVAHGHTGATITSKAQEINADLIVMGASPRSSLNKWMLGSTLDFVLNNAACDCLVIGSAPQGKDKYIE